MIDSDPRVLLAPTVADLCGQVRAVNPFTDNRVNGPAPGDVDVGAIHDAAFERLAGLARDARSGRRGLGAVLWGEAGIGKSHLLARLARWADHGGQAVFVYLHNLQAAPALLPRAVLRGVVNVLTRGRGQSFFHTPFFGLVHAAVLEAIGHDLRFYSWSQLRRAYDVWLDRLGADDLPGPALIDRTAHDVLFRFFLSACRAHYGREDGTSARLAVRWLSGHPLDLDQGRSLGLAPAPGEETLALEDSQQIKGVLVALTRLAASHARPFVLAFDQVDNLDDEQMAALARFLEALLDSSPNLLVVTAGVQASLLRWHETRVIQDSAWDRLAQFEVRLGRLTNQEAVRLVRARLDAFLAPYTALNEVRRRCSADELFPLGRSWHDRALKDRVDLRPRDVINWAREGWRRQQEDLARRGDTAWLADGMPPLPPDYGDEAPPTEEEIRAAIDRKVAEKLADFRAWRLRELERLPADADHLAGRAYALLVQCRDAGCHHVLDVERSVPPANGARPACDLALLQKGESGPLVRTGLLVLMVESAKSVAAFLKRLVEMQRPPDRLVLATDARIGLPLGEKGRDYYEQLKQRHQHHFQVVPLDLAEQAALDALDAIVRQAKSGDLEIEPRPSQSRPASEDEVVGSHVRHNRYRACRLLRELLGGVPDAQPESADDADVVLA
jgi:hypothetical protein